MGGHTPGPWFTFPLLIRDHGGYPPIFENGLWAILPEANPEQVPLAIVDRANDHHEPTRLRAEFDARLIAAAPDLYEAASDVISHRIGDLPEKGWIRDNDASRAALARLAAALLKAKDQP